MAPRKKPAVRIDAFDLLPGRIIARKYEVIAKLGAGWEGEVYQIRERNTGIARAAKLFFPHRNIRNRTSTFYARKLHTLRHCPVVIQYHTEEIIRVRSTPVMVLISEYVEGEILREFLEQQPGTRLRPFQALHLLYALAVGVECIHQHREYHGDLHSGNIIVQRFGLGFDLKLMDMFQWASLKAWNRQDDICDLVRLLYDALGGARHYPNQPEAIKAICRGLKRSLILDRFPTMSHLRSHLETMEW